MKKINFLAIFAFIGAFTACNLEKSIEITLPAYSSKLIVECYLDPNKPYKALLTESQGFTESPSVPNVEGATIVIRYKGKPDTLRYQPSFDSLTQKVINYSSNTQAVYDTVNPYELLIIDQKGRKLEATCKFMPRVKIDSVRATYRKDSAQDSLAYLFVRFRDNPKIANFYRMSLQKDKPKNDRDSRDFHFGDLFFDEEGGIGTAYDYRAKQKVLISLYHLEPTYYNFIRSTQAAARANANPFSEPAVVLTNVKGDGTGIFAALSYSQVNYVVPENKK